MQRQIVERLKGDAVPIQLPVGAEDHFEGVIDLVKMKAIIWDDASQGVRFEYRDIPANMQAEAEAWREKMVEKAAEANETLLEKYLSGEALSEEEIKQGLRARTVANEIVPMLCGSAFKNKGVQAMLDAVIDYLPSPVDVPAIKGHDERDREIERHPTDREPFSALAFKIMTDPFVGQLVFFRAYSGVVKSGDSVYIPGKEKKERLGRILQMHANERREITEVYAGDIAAAVGGEGRHHRRYAQRPGARHHPGTHGVPRTRDLAGGGAQDQGRPGKDGHRAGQAGTGRSVVPRAHR